MIIRPKSLYVCIIPKGNLMKKKLLALSIALALAGTSGILHAEGKLKAGKNKAASCAGCHGEKGNSAMPMFPKLASQNITYLVRQLQAFKSDARNDPTMAPMAMGLSDQDMEDLAVYYNKQRITRNELPVLMVDEDEDEDEDEEEMEESSGETAIDPAQQVQDLITQGSDLYRNGDVEREVSACIACHGPYGEGNEPAGFPVLKSQHADYLIKTLTDFKTGARSDSPNNMMNLIAKKMSEEEIQAVSYYISMMKP